MGQSTSQSVGTAMVTSKSGLSLLDYPLDRQNCDVVCNILTEMTDNIIATWIVARPINGVSKYEHWCVIVQGRSLLISIDFLEHHGKASFRLHQKDSLDIFKYTESKQYRIVSSVTPSPLIHPVYGKYLDEEEQIKLAKYIKENNKKMKKNKQLQSEMMNDVKSNDKIKCKKKICHIADFLDMWTRIGHEQQTKNNDKPYNAISHNCQQFAVHLFEWLVCPNYKNKVEYASKQTQSPADIKAYKKELENKAQ